jgi:hypothetical protein
MELAGVVILIWSDRLSREAGLKKLKNVSE